MIQIVVHPLKYILSCSKAPSRNRLSPISCISFQNLFFKDFNQKTGNGIFLKWNGFITAHVRLQLITDRDNIVILLLLINRKTFPSISSYNVEEQCVKTLPPHPQVPILF